MGVEVIPKARQGSGAFNGGEIIENKPIGFPQDRGEIKPYSNLFYWAYAEAKTESTIGLHPHQGFEIMSFVLRGSIRHFDTKLNEWRTLSAGDAQIIRAGNGISHAEHMGKDAVMFQIWVDPNLNKTLTQPASYDDYKSADFPIETVNGFSVKHYVGADTPLQMDSEGIKIQEWSFADIDAEIVVSENDVHSIYLMDGAIQLNGAKVAQDDFVIVSEVNKLAIKSEGEGRFFMISSPKRPTYKTYVEQMAERMG